MKCTTQHITLILGGNPESDALRKALGERELPFADVVTHLRGVRRSLVRGDQTAVILCMALDERTVERFGDDVASLIEAEGCFDSRLQVIGLLDDNPLSRQAARLGCHIYAPSIEEAVAAIELLGLQAELGISNGGLHRSRFDSHHGSESRLGAASNEMDDWMVRLGF